MYIVIYYLVDYYHCIYYGIVNIAYSVSVVVSEKPPRLLIEKARKPAKVAKKRGSTLKYIT